MLVTECILMHIAVEKWLNLFYLCNYNDMLYLTCVTHFLSRLIFQHEISKAMIR